jgi:hypothetical protein
MGQACTLPGKMALCSLDLKQPIQSSNLDGNSAWPLPTDIQQGLASLGHWRRLATAAWVWALLAAGGAQLGTIASGSFGDGMRQAAPGLCWDQEMPG